MFGEKQNYFKNGRIDQAALVAFIKDIKKNTSLSDEDAATLAASKVRSFCQTQNTLQTRTKSLIVINLGSKQ